MTLGKPEMKIPPKSLTKEEDSLSFNKDSRHLKRKYYNFYYDVSLGYRKE